MDSLTHLKKNLKKIRKWALLTTMKKLFLGRKKDIANIVTHFRSQLEAIVLL